MPTRPKSLRLKLVLLIVLALGPGWLLGTRVLSPWTGLRVVELIPNPESSAPRDAESPETLKIATFNIAHGRGGRFGASNWQRRSLAGQRGQLDALGDHIRSVDADLVLLNEVDFRALWSRHLDQAAHLAERTGYRYRVEQRNIDATLFGLSLRFGNVLLSRFPIIDAEKLRFEPFSPWQRRLAGNHDGILATVATPAGPLTVIGLHLEVRSEAIRVQAARQISERCRGLQSPVIVLGDLNSTPSAFPKSQHHEGRNAIDVLLDSGLRADPTIEPTAQHFTFPSQAPASVIDWILAGPMLELRSTRAVPSNLSDHLLVAAHVHRVSAAN